MRLWALTALALAFTIGHLIVFGQAPLLGSGNVDLIKVEWTVAAIIGLLFSGWFLSEIAQDSRALKQSRRNGDSHATIEILFLLGLTLVGVHGLLTVLGINSMTHMLPRHIAAGDNIVQVFLTVWAEVLIAGLARVNILRLRLQYGEAQPSQ